MSNLLIARTFYPFQKCCADAIFVPHYFEISIFHMKRPKIKTQFLVNLSTAEICVMVGTSSPLEESFTARPDGWILATLVFGHLSALDRMTFIVVQYLQYSATCFDQYSDLLQALDN